jgi:hypothetical protein
MENGLGGGAQRCGGLTPGEAARAESAFLLAPKSTPMGSRAKPSIRAIFLTETSTKPQKARPISEWAVIRRLRAAAIRKKVIGHRMSPFVAAIGTGKRVGRPAGALALLHKPARQHGSGVFLDPLIQQSGHFLAEIGDVIQSGQFEVLEGVPGSGQQELPRWLCQARDHKASEKERLNY